MDRSGEPPESDEEEEEEEEDAAELAPPPRSRGPRASVSAEAYGSWNTMKAFTPPAYPKDPEQIAQLKQILGNSFMFSSLEKKDMDAVIGAMQERVFEAGSRIIAEGDDGEHLYVIEEGSPVCKKKIDGADKIVKTCGPGDVFGELALLYKCPRAATVEAVDKCKAWELDSGTFNYIVKDAASKKHQQRDSFLQNVDLLKSIDQYERAQICDALKCDRYAKDQMVVTQGADGDRFYIVESGSLKAIKDGKEVMDYNVGDYFGELALLKSQARACSVQVTGEEATLLWMDRKAFNKLLGPLEDVLRRKGAEYEAYVK